MKLGGEFLQPRAGGRVKTSLLLRIVGAAFGPVEHVDLHETEQVRRSLARPRTCRCMVLSDETSGGRAALDDVGADLIGGDLFEPGPAVPVAGEPTFGGLAILGEMQKLGAVAEI